MTQRALTVAHRHVLRHQMEEANQCKAMRTRPGRTSMTEMTQMTQVPEAGTPTATERAQSSQKSLELCRESSNCRPGQW